MEDVSRSGFYKFPLGYDKVDWFVDEVIKLENKLVCYFNITKKDIIMTEEDAEAFKKREVCRFCEKIIFSDKVSDHCHLAGKYRGPAHSKCNIDVSQDKSDVIPFFFHNFCKCDCHLFFKLS